MSIPLCIFGEVLFDHFPDGQRVLGGAPFNVAWNLQGLGKDVQFISRVGSDAEGELIRKAMQAHGMSDLNLQVDNEQATGRVQVTLVDNEPAYDIVAPCAYDRIEPLPDQTAQCGLLYHGTLALRDPVSRTALQALLEAAPQTVFVDVNLRTPWWNKADVLSLMKTADWVKLNTDELQQLSNTNKNAEPSARDFLETHQLTGLIVTHGSAGAELLTADNQHYQVKPDHSTPVVDTVGAGDAFASVILLGLLDDWPLHETLQRAQAFASAQVGQRGATVADPAYYQKFSDDWKPK